MRERKAEAPKEDDSEARPGARAHAAPDAPDWCDIQQGGARGQGMANASDATALRKDQRDVGGTSRLIGTGAIA